MLRFLGNMLVFMMTIAMIGAAAGIYVMYSYSRDLPDYKQLAQYEPATVTRLYAGDGRLLAEYATQKRVFVPISAIPRRLRNAFLAAEDQDFYNHPGIDIKSILRAALTNAANIGTGHSLVGGSTITQQVVKNFLLTSERSLDRKIKEAILAFRISNAFSKDRILELYLNEIYLGLGSYGVAAAALNYFDKSIDELTIEEAAFLAALPKAPAHYDPRTRYDAAKERRDWVISRMVEDGYVTPAEAKKAQDTPITIRDHDETEMAQAAFFAEEARREIVARYGSKTLYEGGLAVRTTLDPQLQRICKTALNNGVQAYDRRHGWRGPVAHFPSVNGWREQLQALTKPVLLPGWQLAVVTSVQGSGVQLGFEDGSTGTVPFEEMSWARKWLPDQRYGAIPSKPSDVLDAGDVVMVEPVKEVKNRFALRQMPNVNGAVVALDPHTGRILAMVGGLSFENTEFNRVTQARRQPGSAFKPFIYLAAMENGFTPSSIVLDAPIELPQGPGLPMWRPQNYHDDFLGPTTLRVGLEKSRNVMTVRLAQKMGLPKIQEVATRFGIYDDLPQNFSAVLGAKETTLLRLTTSYAMLVNSGKRVYPYLIERIQDRNGKTIYKWDRRVCAGCQIDSDAALRDPVVPVLPDMRAQVTDPQSAYQMVSLLEGVVQRGTGKEASKLGYPLAGKTGTTNNSYDTWFIGFTPDLVVGTMVGFDQPKTMGAKETGASVALPIFIETMREALKDRPAFPFRIPDGIQLIKVDATTGRPPVLGTNPAKLIFEAFKEGTGPDSTPFDPIMLPESGGITPPPNPDAAPTVGTGGLY